MRCRPRQPNHYEQFALASSTPPPPPPRMVLDYAHLELAEAIQASLIHSPNGRSWRGSSRRGAAQDAYASNIHLFYFIVVLWDKNPLYYFFLQLGHWRVDPIPHVGERVVLQGISSGVTVILGRSFCTWWFVFLVLPVWTEIIFYFFSFATILLDLL